MKIFLSLREVELGRTNRERKKAIDEASKRRFVYVKQRNPNHEGDTDYKESPYEAGEVVPHPRDDKLYMFKSINESSVREERRYSDLQGLLM